MKTMKKVLSMLMSVIMIFSSVPTGALAASAAAPAALTVIQEEAFAGMSQLSGLLALPENVSAIGRNAFSGSGIYALDLPSGMQSVADQGETDMAYVYVRGSQTVLEGSGWVKYVFANEGSAAQQWAQSQNIPFASTASLAVHEGFYYQLGQDGTAALLCAADENAVPARVVIPDAVNEHNVTAIGPDAFMGCGQVETIVVPAAAAAAEDAYAGAPNAAVYVKGEAAKLRIEAVDSVWPWAGKGKVRIAADRPAHVLNQQNATVELRVHVGNEHGNLGKSQIMPIVLDDNGEAIVEIAAESYMMVEAIANGYTYAAIELAYVEEASAFTVDPEAAMITLPLADLAQETDPIFSVESAEDNQTILELVAGKKHKQKIVANNPYVTEGIYVITAYSALDGSVVGMTEMVLERSRESVINIQIPADFAAEEAELAYCYRAIDAEEEVCFANDARTVVSEPKTVIVTNPLAFESNHGQSGLINTMWKYAVDGAETLSVTFDMAMPRSAYLRVGSQREMDLDTARFFIGRTANDQTVTFSGSEVVFWLRATPESAETWGFKVKGIVATMADGSQVAVLDPNAAVPANLSFRQAAQGLRGSWDAVPGAAAYEVYVQREGETEYEYVETNSGEPVTTNSIDTIAFFTQAQCGVLNYAVCAVFADGSRSQLSAPFQMIALAPPTIVSARQTGDTAFTLVWESVENAESYQILSNRFITIASGITDTTYVIELPADADRNAVYSYYVQAVGPFGPGVQCKPITFNGLKDNYNTEIVLSATGIKLDAFGATYTLQAEVISDTLTNKSVRYTSLNHEIADVDENGVITAFASGTTYIAVTAADGTSARCRVDVAAERCVVNIVDASLTVETGKETEITLSFEGSMPTASDTWLEFDVIYLDENGTVIGSDGYGYSDIADETHSLWLYRYGAARAVVTVSNNSWFEAGENKTVEITFTRPAAEMLDCTVEFVTYEFYPGAQFQVYVKANNPETISGELPVTIISADGAINVYAGTISQAQPELRADAAIPANWQYFDETEETEYEIFVNIGDHYSHSRWMYLWGFNPNDVTVQVGRTLERWEDDYCQLSSEWPLTFAVADPTIASIDETGFITGLKAGETTATVTVKSGASRTFTITVIEPSQDDDFTVPTGKPAVYIYAPREKMEAIPGQWDVYFCVAADVPETIYNADEYQVRVSFLDENHNEIDYYTSWISAYGDNVASLSFSADDFEPGVRYVEAGLISTSDYTISSPDCAIVEVVYPQSSGEQTPEFDLPLDYGGTRHSPGQTFRIPVECTTPELLSGPVAVRGVMSDGFAHVESISTLMITPDAPKGSLEVKLSPNAISGQYLSIDFYAGKQCIGCFDFTVGSGIGVMAYGFDMTVGATRQFPYAIADGVDISLSDLTFFSDDESIAVVDENGLITAVAPGRTFICIEVPSRYGFIWYDSIWLEVYETAGENVPVATMNTNVTEAFFGDPIPLTFKLDKPFETDVQGNIQFAYTAALLDANKNLLSNYWKVAYISPENALAGAEVMLDLWPSTEYPQEAAYLRLAFIGEDNENPSYIAQDNAFLIKITGIPEPGYVRYSFEAQRTPPYRPGDYIYGNVKRFEIDNAYTQATWEMKDAEGNVYGSGTFGRGSTSSWGNISTRGLAPLQTHTMYLYINGEKTDATFSFQLEEPQMYLNYTERLALNNQGWINFFFNSDYEYSTTVTFASTDESVFTVSADGTITPVGIGAAEIIATTAGGQAVSALIMVFDPSNAVAPEMYLTEMDGDNASVQWFGGIPLTFGTTAELYRVLGPISAAYRVEFLDANGYIVAETSSESGLYHSMLVQEMEAWQYIGDNVWKTAFIGNAVQLRLTLLPSPFSSSVYTVDPDRCTLTMDLPLPSEYQYPIVTYTATRNVTPGGVFSAEFTCINPATLREAREVKLYNGQTGECVATGYLTAANPQVTLTWQLPEDWENYDEIRLQYPASAHNGTASSYITTYLSAFTGFTIDQRTAVGNDRIVYPSYEGNPPAVTYTSSDESIAKVELYDGYCARIIGIAPGVAEITATSGGKTFTAKAVICDFNNTQKPVLYLDQSQNGMEAVWNDVTEIKVCTSTAPELIGDSVSLNFKYEYLDANGEVLEIGTDRQYNYALFANGSETFYCDLAAGEAYAKGAKSIRVTLTADDYYYALAQNDLSVTFTIPGIENVQEPVFVLMADAYSQKGTVYTAKAVCLNPEKMTGDYTVSVDYFFGEDEYTINAASPEITFEIEPQDNSAIDLNVRITGADNFNEYMYQYVRMLDISMRDMVVAVGDGVSADQFTFDQPVPVYSIADENIATVDASGMITGVSAGVTTVTVRFGNLSNQALVRVYDRNAAETTLVTVEACASAPVWPWTTEVPGTHMVTIKANSSIEKLAGEMTGNIYIDFYDDAGNKVWNQTYSKYVYAGFAGSATENIVLDLYNVPFAQIAHAGATKARVTFSNPWPSNYYVADSSYAEIPMEDLSQMTNEPLIYTVARNLGSTLYYDNTYTIAFIAGNPYAAGEYEVSIKVPDYSYDSYQMTRDVELPYRVVRSGKLVPQENPITELSFVATRDLTPYASISLECFARPTDGSAAEKAVGWFSRSLAEAPVYTPVADLTGLQSEHNYADNTKLYLSYTYENAVSLEITLDEKSRTEGGSDLLSIGNYEEMLSDSFSTRLGGSIGGRTVTVAGDTAYFKFTSDYSVTYWGFMVESIVATMADGSQVTLTNPYSNLVPELYLAKSETAVQWFDELPAILGTTSNLDYISSNLQFQYQIEMLDSLSQVITNGSTIHNDSFTPEAQEQEYSLYIDDALWQAAFEQNAAQIRLSLIPSDDESFTIDPERVSVTYQLSDVWLHPYPIVTYTASNEVCIGGDFSATFTCLNPAALNNPCEVALYDYRYDTLVASGYLTAAEPEITLTWQVPDDWSTYSQIELRYPSRSGDGTVSTTIRPTVYRFNDFTIDDRVAVGGNKVFYPDYSGNYPPIVYTSLDESIATVELYNGYCAKVTGVAPGVAEITASCAGKTFTTRVVVYDPNNTEKPVLHLDQSQNGKEAVWDDSTAIRVCTSTAPELIDSSYSYFNVDFKYEWLDENGAVLATFAKRNSHYTAFAYGWADFSFELGADEAYAAGARSIRVTLVESKNNYTLAENDLSITLAIPGVEAAQEPVFVLLANDYAQKDVQYTAKVVCLNPEKMVGDYTVTVDDNGSNSATYIMNANSPELTFSMAPRNSSIYLHVEIEDAADTFYKQMYESITLVNIAMHDMVTAVAGTVSANQSFPSGLYPIYAIEDESIATVDPATGLITGVSAGTTTVYVDFGYGLSNSALVRVYDPATAEKIPLTLEACAYAPTWPWKSDAVNQHHFNIRANGDASKLGAPAYLNVKVEFYDDENNKVGDFTSWQTVGANFVGTMSETKTVSLSQAPFAQLAAAGATKARVSISSLDYSCSDYYSFDSSAYVDIPMADLSQMPDEPLLSLSDENLPNTLYYDVSYTVAFTAGNPYAAGTYKVSVQTEDPNHYGQNLTLAETIWDLEESSQQELSFTVSQDQIPYSYFDLEYYIQPEDDSAEPALIVSKQYSLAAKPVYTQVSSITELESEHNYANSTKLYLSYTYENAVSLQITLDEESDTESRYDFLAIGGYDEMLSENYANNLSGSIGGQTVTVSGDTAYFKFTSDGSGTRWGFRVKTIVATMADGSQVTISNPYCGVVPEMYLAYAEDSESIGWYGTLPAVLGTTSDIEFISDELEIYYELELLDANGDVIDDVYDPYAPYSVSFAALEQEQDCQLEMSTNLWDQAFEQGAAKVRVILLENYDDSYTIQPDCGAITLEMTPYEEHPFPIVTFELSEVVVPGGELVASFTCHNPACLSEPRQVALYDDQTNQCVATGYLTAENPQVTLTWQLPEDWDENCYVKLEHPVPYHNGIAIRPLSPAVLRFNGFEMKDRVVKGDYRVFYPDLNGASATVTYTSSDESIATVEPYGSYGVKVNGIAPGVAEITAACAGKSFTAKVVVYDPMNTQDTVLYLDQSWNGKQAALGAETIIRVASSTAPELMDRPNGGDFYATFKYEWMDENGQTLLAASYTCSPDTQFADGWVDCPVKLYADEALAVGAASIRVTLIECDYRSVLAESDLSITLDVPGVEDVQEPVFALVADNYAQKNTVYTAKVVCLNPETLDGDYTVHVNYDAAYTVNAASPEVEFWVSPTSEYGISLHAYIHGPDAKLYQHLQQSVTLIDIGMRNMVVAVGDTISADQFGYSYLFPVFSIADENIASIDPITGLITGKSAGTTTVHVKFSYNLSNSILMRVYDPDSAEITPLTLGPSTYFPEWAWSEDPVNPNMITITANGDRDKLGGVAEAGIKIAFFDDEGNQVWDTTYSAIVQASFVGTASDNVKLSLSDVPFPQIAAAGATKARVSIDSLYFGSSEYYSCDPESYAEISMKDLSQMTDDMLLFVDDSALPNMLFYGSTYSVSFVAGNPYAAGKYKVSLQARDDSYYGYYDVITENIWEPSKDSVIELDFNTTMDLAPDGYLTLACFIQPEDGSGSPVKICETEYRVIDAADVPVYTQVTTLAELQSEHEYDDDIDLRLSYTVENAVKLEIQLHEDSYTEDNWDYLYFADYDKMLSDDFVYKVSGPLGRGIFTIYGDTVYIRFTSDSSNTYWGFAVSSIKATMADGTTVTITE